VTDVDRLFSVPLEDFVAERKQVAKELREAGEREAAAEVAKLPKPTPPAWALNRLARDEPDEVGAWLDAAEELREVSESPGAGLREAIEAHRDATRTLLGVVRDRARPGGKPLSEPMLVRVRELLQAATVDAQVAEALRRGVVVESGEVPSLGGAQALGAGGEAGGAQALGAADEAGAGQAPTAAGEGGEGAGAGAETSRSSGAARRGSARGGGRGSSGGAGRASSGAGGRGSSGAAAARGPSRAAERRAAKEREAERKAKERADRLAELERHIAAAEEELARLREDATERNAAVAEADERLADAQRALHRTESEASAAHAAADEANNAVATAERELRQLTRQLRSASS
jgi:hypothetical protein